jgi:hypothetical protein
MYVLMTKATGPSTGREVWSPNMYAKDPIDLAVSSAKMGYGQPQNLDISNVGSDLDKVTALITGKDALNRWAATEAYEKVQRIAGTPLDQTIDMSAEALSELHEDLHLYGRHENRRGLLKTELNQQLDDLEETLDLQEERVRQASERANLAKTEIERQEAHQQFNAEMRELRKIEHRVDTLSIIADGLRGDGDDGPDAYGLGAEPGPGNRPGPGFEDEVAVTYESEMDALDADIARTEAAMDGMETSHDPDPELMARSQTSNTVHVDTAWSGLTEPAVELSGNATIDHVGSEPVPVAEPVETKIRPGAVGSPEHKEAMDFANRQLSGGIPISELAASASDTPTATASRVFSDAHAAATENRPQMAKSASKGKAKAQAKTLRRGGKR